MKKILSLALVLTVALLAMLGFSSEAYADGNEDRVISVSGEGRVTAVPNIATINIGVEAEAKKVAEAQEMAAEAMNKIMVTLKKSEIAQKDIQTKHYYINPVWEKGEIKSFRVGNIASAKVRDINKVGIIIDDVVKAGGDLTRIEGISFGVDDPSPYYNEAREQAVNDAKAKAEQLARLNGVKLGKPIHISEGRASIPSYEVRGMEYAKLAPPISPGEIEIVVNVSISYAIK